METFECIEKRRSVRNFLDKPVEWEKIGDLLRAGQLAPTSGNVQDFKFVVVTDKSKISALANACLKQHWIAKAPVIIIVYSEPKINSRFYGLRGEKLYTIQNSAAAVENILLGATDIGLASCWVGAFDETMINNVIGAPENVRPQAIIPIGYSADEPEQPHRNTLVELVYINSWKGKLVNPDMLFDNYSEVLRNKLTEIKNAAIKNAPRLKDNILNKGKEHIKIIHGKITNKIYDQKQKKDEKISADLGDEEEILSEFE